MSVDEQRAYARRMAAESIAEGDPTGWFERLYAAAQRVVLSPVTGPPRSAPGDGSAAS
jgi:hypothetical protein